MSLAHYTLQTNGDKWQWRTLGGVPMSPVFDTRQAAVLYRERMPMITEQVSQMRRLLKRAFTHMQKQHALLVAAHKHIDWSESDALLSEIEDATK